MYSSKSVSIKNLDATITNQSFELDIFTRESLTVDKYFKRSRIETYIILFSVYHGHRNIERRLRERYRKCRHTIASTLLTSSADFLFFDKIERDKLEPLVLI